MPTYLSPGVYVEEFDSGPVPLAGGATAVAAFVGYTQTIPGGDMTPKLVTSWTQYQQFYGGFVDGAILPYSVYGFFNNGGTTAYIVPIKWTQPREPEILDQPSIEIPQRDAEDKALFTVRRAEGAGPGEVAIAIEPTVEGDDDKTFGVRIRLDGKEVAHYDGITVAQAVGDEFAASNAAKYVTVEVGDGAADALPKVGRYPLVTPPPNKREVAKAEFEGQFTTRTGIAGLEIHEDVTMLMVPDLYTLARDAYVAANPDAPGTWSDVDLGVWKAVQTMMIVHCENQISRMAILDPPPSKLSAQDIADWRANTAMYDSQHAAFYYPWIEVNDPVTDKVRFVPPSGHMAGLWARVDSTRGVWKAPANEVVQGALDVQYKMTQTEQDSLNPDGINAIRPFGTRGIRVWGTRTLSSNALWNYIPVRRLFSWIEKSIMDGTQWVVFEPNDQTTWDRVVRTVSNFLTGLWRDGALFGATPDQAFYVKCDTETNPPDSVALGKLVCEIGIAPVKPAEFVIFRVTQWQPE